MSNNGEMTMEEAVSVLKSRTEFEGWASWLEYLADQLCAKRQEEYVESQELVLREHSLERIRTMLLNTQGYSEDGVIKGKNAETRKIQEAALLDCDSGYASIQEQVEEQKGIATSTRITRQYYEDLLRIGLAVLQSRG